MSDLWSFLLQTLTASGAALLLLAVKALFRDKLSPRWQFAVWGILALVLLLPAGPRYVLFNWPFVVETLKSALTGEYGTLTRVTAPVPLPSLSAPHSAAEWLYTIYVVGVLFFLLRYLFSYLRLRLALRGSRPAECPAVRAVAERYSRTDEPARAQRYSLPTCPAVEVDGLAFVCGVFHPVLVLPAGGQTDEKVILHELLHLKHHDVLWGLLICFFRCIHWCNPLLWYCANRAGNDLEALCDQRVLERLEGEERRDYGRILLAMANEKYARAPGTSSMSNGGKNIRRRIEAIVRFKRYPAGMALASACVALVLALPLLTGSRAQAIYDLSSTPAVMASARTVPCTTYAGALDTYAKAVMTDDVSYRAMCAPLEEQNGLAAALENHSMSNFGLPVPVRRGSSYRIYNLAQTGDNAYEGILVVELEAPPPGERYNEWGHIWVAVQSVRAERQDGRWVVLPQEPFRAMSTEGTDIDEYSGNGLPARYYEGQAGDFTIRLQWRTEAYIRSPRQVEQPARDFSPWFYSHVFDTTPQPDGSFADNSIRHTEIYAVYTGDPAEKGQYTTIKVSAAPFWEREGKRTYHEPGVGDSSGSSSDGSQWASRSLEDDWESPLWLSGSGGSYDEAAGMPDSYTVRLYLNGHAPAELALLPVEGGELYVRP